MRFARQASLPFPSLPSRGVAPAGSGFAATRSAAPGDAGRRATSGLVGSGSTVLLRSSAKTLQRSSAPPAGVPQHRLFSPAAVSSPAPARAQAGAGESVHGETGLGEIGEAISMDRSQFVLEIIGAGLMMAAFLVLALFL